MNKCSRCPRGQQEHDGAYKTCDVHREYVRRWMADHDQGPTKLPAAPLRDVAPASMAMARTLATRGGGSPDTWYRLLLRLRRQRMVTLGTADRILTALGLHLSSVYVEEDS